MLADPIRWRRKGWLWLALAAVVAFLFPQVQTTRLASAGLAPLTRVAGTTDKIALTFDVTHGEQEIRQIIATLDQAQVKATFFLSYSWLSLYPDLARQLVDGGHTVGTMGYKLVDMSQLPEPEVADHLSRAQNQFEQTLGRPAVYLRPFGGQVSPTLLTKALEVGLTPVTWSLDGGDGQIPALTPEKISRRVLNRASGGEVVLLVASDFSPSTAAALPQILAGLEAKGLKPVTLAELLQ